MEMLTNHHDQPTQVLLVDDDKRFLWSLRELLEVYDFDVYIARSGSEALEVLRSTDPDCVVMDIVMPEQSGIEVFREIKPLKPKLPVIFMTGYAHATLEGEARDEGAKEVITKPIDIKYLIGLLNGLRLSSAA